MLHHVRKYIQQALLTSLALALGGCSKTNELADFTSDGCSLCPDQSLISEKDWCECCVEHDIAYWQGGTEAQRLEADKKLRDCVLAQTDNKVLAETMYHGVRFGGSPHFYNWYRWGYGWSDGRKYRELTTEEQRQVTEKLVWYYESAEVTPCGAVIKTK